MTRIELFHALHAPGELLIFANAWDAGSARLFESLGSKAIATTSSGVAWANAYPDGDALPADLLLACVGAIARAVAVPLTVDVEGGYSDDAEVVAATVDKVVAAGAVGINIEDGNAPPARLAAKIAAIRATCGDGVFINARIDVHLRGIGAPATRPAELAARIARYAQAGADGVFVPGLADPTEIAAAVVAAAPLPVNLMAVPSLPDATALRRLGVRRLSAGGALATAAIVAAGSLAQAFIATGDSAALCGSASGTYSYARLNALMQR